MPLRAASSLVALLSLSLSLGSAACAGAPHVALHAPAASAPPAERLAAYEALRPGDQVDEALVNQRTGEVLSRTPSYLVLGNGERVHHADDLAAVVPEGSASARSARRTAELEAQARPWSIAGYTFLGVGLGTALVSMVTSPGTGDDGFTTHLGISAGGIGLAVVGYLVTSFVGGHYRAQAAEERTATFLTYDADLRQQLDVCVDGTRIVACPPAP